MSSAEGFFDETSTYTPDQYGDGDPPGYWVDLWTITYADAYRNPQQAPWTGTTENAYVGFPGTTTGTYAFPADAVEFSYDDGVGLQLMESGNDLTVVVTAFGDVGADIVGTFSGTAIDGGDASHSVTDGRGTPPAPWPSFLVRAPGGRMGR